MELQKQVTSTMATEKLQEVEILVQNLAEAEGKLELGYAKLAYLLRDVSEQQYWKGVYKSFGDFLNHLSTKYQIGKAQLYNYLSTARDLGESVTPAQLNEMGISKALVLRDAKRATGVVPEEALTAALNPNVTVKEVKKMLFDTGVLLKPEDGDWYDLDFSCYITEEEKKEINDAANAARHTDPPINEELRPFQQRKEILLRFAREFLSTYAEDVIEGGQGI